MFEIIENCSLVCSTFVPFLGRQFSLSVFPLLFLSFLPFLLLAILRSASLFIIVNYVLKDSVITGRGRKPHFSIVSVSVLEKETKGLLN